MAAFTDLAEYLNSLETVRELIPVTKAAFTGAGNRASSTWLSTPLAGAAPTTAVAPTSATVGAMGQQNAGTEDLYVPGAHLALATMSGTAPTGACAGMMVLCDRLSHQGGLSGIVTTAGVTTNLPTAALTRYTNGEGVMAAVEIYTAVGATGTLISCTYTNEAGTGSRVSPQTTIGGTNFNGVGRMLLIPLQAGDTGIRSIESSTLLATTGTAGAFGYTLFKPLLAFAVDVGLGGTVPFSLFSGGMAGGMPPIVDDACLFWMYIGDQQSAGSPGPAGILPFVTV